MEYSKKNVALRFKELLDILGLNVPSFAKALQYSRADKLYNILNGVYYPSFEILSDITKFFEDVNVDYLITGRGQLLQTENSSGVALKLLTLPLLPYDGCSGPGAPAFSDRVVEDYYAVPDFKESDFILRVKGDSMVPLLKSNDLVACKRVDKLQDNYVHAIYTKSMGILIKYISVKTMPDHLTFISENKDYSPFSLPPADIVDIALVTGAILLSRFKNKK